MSESVTILDPGMGNIRSVVKAFEAIGAKPVVTQKPELLRAAKRLVVPGVGAFGDCMAFLDGLGVRKEVTAAATEARDGKSGRYFLGICLGMQILFDESEEFGAHKGLGIFSGSVKRLPDEPGSKVPHMGWSEIQLEAASKKHTLWKNLGADTKEPAFYFVHSYCVVPKNREVAAARCDFTAKTEFVAAVQKGNLAAVQFHPEKSQDAGLTLLKNFLTWSGVKS